MNSQNNSLILSFCVPVYNNAEAALNLAENLLVSKDERFELIISDDASTDNTQELLSKIHDSRFRYYRNEKNLGAHKNWEHSLSLGLGEWLYLSMGREILHGANVSKLIDILDFARKNNITYMKDGYYPDEKLKIFSGIDAMSKFLKIEHPTADIYDGNIFRSIPNRTCYFEISDMFPENYIRRDLLLHGKGAFIDSGIYIREESIAADKLETKSTIEHGKNIFDMYFAPRRLCIQYRELIDMILADESDFFTKTELDEYFRVKFNELLLYVSVMWRIWCGNKLNSIHYGYKIRHVSQREMLGNIFKAYRDMKTHLKQSGLYSLKRELIIDYSFIRMCIRMLSEPLGIWNILHAIKNFPRLLFRGSK